MYETLKTIFQALDDWITEKNIERRSNDLFSFANFEIILLGQSSLLANERVVSILHLYQTLDVDALLKNVDFEVKKKLVQILLDNRFVYDEDSPLVWIPPGTNFENLFKFENFIVKNIDPESALVSKACKAKEKNKKLIQDALASEKFPNLYKRIIDQKGDIEFFLS